MALPVPTTQGIANNIVTQLEGELSQTIPLMPRAALRVLAKVLAGVFVILWKYAGWIFLQLFVRHATLQESTINGVRVRPLVEWGRLFGVSDPDPGEAAQMTINVVVESQTGNLEAGSHLTRVGTGVIYQVVGTIALNAATVQATIRAVADPDERNGVGAIGNLEAGDVVEFVNPLPNVAREATVVALTVTGANPETTEDYRTRIYNKARQKPQGGAYADYVLWAREVPGIIGVYPYTGLPGEVDIYVEADEDSSGSEDGIPTDAQLLAVLASINLEVDGKATRRPANSAPNVLPILREPISVVIDGLDVPADSEDTCKQAIEDGCDEYLRSREPFIVGLSVLPREDRITRSAIGGLVDSIVSSYGGTVTTVELQQGGTNITAYTLGDGEKAKLDGAPVYL